MAKSHDSKRCGLRKLGAICIVLLCMQYESKFEIRADLPGMSKSDIQVHVDHDAVTVSVEKEDKRDDNHEEQGVR